MRPTLTREAFLQDRQWWTSIAEPVGLPGTPCHDVALEAALTSECRHQNRRGGWGEKVPLLFQGRTTLRPALALWLNVYLLFDPCALKDTMCADRSECRQTVR